MSGSRLRQPGEWAAGDSVWSGPGAGEGQGRGQPVPGACCALRVLEGASRRGRMRQSRGTCGWARQGLRLGSGRGGSRRDRPQQFSPLPAPLLSQPPVLGSRAGGFWLGPERVGARRRTARKGLSGYPLPPGRPGSLYPGRLAFCSSQVLPRRPPPPRPHCADGHMSSCYERADTPGQLHVGVTRAEAPLPLYLESCSKSALDLLSCTCWNKRCVFGEVA